VQRRLRSFEDLLQLNQTVCGLQQELHQVLLQNPLLLPEVSAAEKLRVFENVAEGLQEATIDIERAGKSCLLTTESIGELLPWLPTGRTCEVALCDSRLGALYFAAILDMHALESMLTEQFLPLLLTKLPTAEGALRDSVALTVGALKTWVSAKK